ncbi:MAG TPA: DUF5916 domain-containing protein [Gemmatimonadota bacterium]|nr:DUF5916 domain-containing protein [Gemmatimonadota bacterium]
MGRVFPLVLSAFLCGAAPATAQESDTTSAAADRGPEFESQVKPALEVPRATGSIEIDGALDDPGWEGAARVSGFTEFFPDESDRPPVETEAWITYDDERLYVAFLAGDDPAALRSSVRDRDQTGADDYVGLVLDTYGDAAWGYLLFVNPAGVQTDIHFTANREDDGFDIVFDSEARITEDGYQVEMAIPFRSLRFPDRPEQIWRATFWRNHPRESRGQYSWAALSRDDPCLLCQLRTLTGIQGVEPGGALELLPAVIASQASALADGDDPDSGLEHDGIEGEASLGIRYAHPSGVTAEAALNPDFSQVESDVGQIDVNQTFALFFPERRPFFQEGSDLFETYFDVVHTRQINDPDVAVKLIGRAGRTNVAYLGARDAGSPVLLPFQERSFVGVGQASVSNIVRLRRTYGASSYVGALVTDRRLEEGGSGTTYGVDGVHRFLEKYRLEYQLLGSRTAEPDEPGATAGLDFRFDGGQHTAVFDGETYSGFAQHLSLERSGRRWFSDFDYWVSSPTFRTDNGFEFRNDFHRFTVFEELNFYPESAWIDQFTADVRASRLWSYDGVRKVDFIEPTLEFNLKGQTFVEVGHEWGRERFREIDFGGVRRWFVFAQTNFSEPLRGGFFVGHGREIARNSSPPVLGEGTDIEVFATIRPFHRLVFQPSLVHSRLDGADGEEIFSGYVLRNRTTYNFSRRLFLRLVLQYNDFDDRLDIEPLLTYRINPFTLFYVGSTQAFESLGPEAGGADGPDPAGRDELVQTSRQFFAKFQYLFQL